MTNTDIAEHAKRIADSIPEFRKPGLLLLRASKSKTAIRKWAVNFVKDNTRDVLHPVIAGKIAKQLIDLLGLNKRRRYKRAKLGDKPTISEE